MGSSSSSEILYIFFMTFTYFLSKTKGLGWSQVKLMFVEENFYFKDKKLNFLNLLLGKLKALDQMTRVVNHLENDSSRPSPKSFKYHTSTKIDWFISRIIVGV